MADRALVRLYRALGEPTRLRIVRLLAREPELTCSAIAEALGLAPSTLSHHLSILVGAGLLDVRKDASFHLVSLRREVVARYAPALLSPDLLLPAGPGEVARPG